MLGKIGRIKTQLLSVLGMSPQTISYLSYQYFWLQFGEVLQHLRNLKHFSSGMETNDTPVFKTKHVLKYLAKVRPKVLITVISFDL